MPLFDDIPKQIGNALRAKDATRLTALRSIRAAFLTELKKDGAEELSDEVCVAQIRRLAKQRRESIDAFEKGGRPERAAAERAELEVLQEFLPSLADEATTRGWVQQAVEASGASKPGDLGRVMGALMKAHKGEVDGNLARRIAGELLAE